VKHDSICIGPVLLLFAIVCAAGVWLYTQRVLIPYQIADSSAHSRPRGNLSDLYPRWLGARELLLHRRNPYAPEISREIQAGYYGRPLDPTRPSDPKDQQGFAYPLYVVFYLAPTIRFAFPHVQYVFFWVLVGLTLVSVCMWMRIIDWSPSLWVLLCVMALTLGSLGISQGLKLQQLSLFVAPLIACAVLLLIRERQWLAGFLLAVATIKPQLIWLLLLFLLIWTVGNWRGRWRWLASFLLTMTTLIAASEWLLPGWIPKFLHALVQYQKYTGNVSIVHELLPKPLSWIVEVSVLAAVLYLSWRVRRWATSSDQFRVALATVLAITILILPAFSPYNQALLLPCILLAIQQRKRMWKQGLALRTIWYATAVVLAWPWLASTILAALSFAQPQSVQKYWAAPFWTALAIPFAVGILMLFYTFRTRVTSFHAQRTA
jgi:hypothetical protein